MHPSDATADERSLRRFLYDLPEVDSAELEQRAGDVTTPELTGDAKLRAVDTAISMVDLTSLEATDTPEKIRSLAEKARCPAPEHTDTPPVAAVCVYPDLAPTAVESLAGSPVAVASVAIAFPSGRSPRRIKLAEVTFLVDSGVHEVDMVMDRAAFLDGRYWEVLEEIREVRSLCGSACLKVILETGELGNYDNVHQASRLALLAGADFIKTSTGKISPGASLPATQVMLGAVRDWYAETGERRGVKAAGGIRGTDEAIRYLAAVEEVAGQEWLSPSLFRFGASSLLDDLLEQRDSAVKAGGR